MKKFLVGGMVLGCAAMLSNVRVQAQAPSEADKSFIADASQGDLTEIKLSQLALTKSQNSHVKMYAQKMIDDHTTLETNMKPFADKAGVTPATDLNADHQATYDRLSGLSGDGFDKAYVGVMDKDHHETDTKFKSEISSTQNPQLKQTVQQGEKVVAQHTRMADKMSKKMGQTPAGA